MTAQARKGPGDPIAVGDEVALSIEPSERWARIVGIRHHETGMRKFIVRVFRPEDERFPTGEYRTTSTIAMYPWSANGGQP